MKPKRSTQEEPSEESLREIPPMDPLKDSKVFRGPKALQKALAWSRSKQRGRPKKGRVAEGTVPRSIRMPQVVWDELAKLADNLGMSAHALMREAILDKLKKGH